MSVAQHISGAPPRPAARRVTLLHLASALYLAGALIAPVELLIVSSFTVHDLLICAVAVLLVASRRRLEFLPRHFWPAIYFFFLFALLSTFRAPHPLESITQIMEFAFIFFVHLSVTLTLVKTPRMFQASVLLFLAGIMFGAVTAMAIGQVQGAGRTQIFYSNNPNRLGYPTAYSLPFILYMLTNLWRRSRLLALLVGAPVFYLMFWALTASGSRSATVGTLAALLVYLTFRGGLKVDLRSVFQLGLTAVAIGLLVYGMYRLELFPATLTTRIERSLAGEESLTYDRVNLAEAALLGIQESPFIGVGLDNFRYVARRYVWQATDQLPHNMWLQFMANIGIVGTLGFFAVIAGWFVWMLRADRASTSRSQRELIWAFVASMLAVNTIYMFLPIMSQRQYWLLYGLGLALALRTCQKPRAGERSFGSQW